jgi:hypothetical protein
MFGQCKGAVQSVGAPLVGAPTVKEGGHKGRPYGPWARGRPYAWPAPLPSAACAAARRAIGTRNGEHDT